MLALKRIVTVAVMVYLLLALLFLLVPAVRNTVAGVDSDPLNALNPLNLPKERDFYHALAWVGVFVLDLHLVVENLDSTLLRRSVTQQEGKINALKAQLYDAQQAPAALPGTALPPTTYSDDRPLA